MKILECFRTYHDLRNEAYRKHWATFSERTLTGIADGGHEWTLAVVRTHDDLNPLRGRRFDRIYGLGTVDPELARYLEICCFERVSA